MEALEGVDKYRKIISSILKCDIEDIKIFVDSIEMKSLQYKESQRCNWDLGEYTVTKKENDEDIIISSWKLYQFPHCCAFMVSCNVLVNKNYRNKGIGTLLNQLRQDIGKAFGYSAIFCTDVEQNIHQRKILKTNGWQDIYSRVNKRTKNNVYLSVINI